MDAFPIRVKKGQGTGDRTEHVLCVLVPWLGCADLCVPFVPWRVLADESIRLCSSLPLAQVNSICTSQPHFISFHLFSLLACLHPSFLPSFSPFYVDT